MYVLAARPSVGKSALAGNLALNVAKTGKMPICVFSLEMSTDEYVQRFLSRESGIENNFLETGNVSDSQWQPLSVAIAQLSEQQIFINDESCPSLNEIRSQVIAVEFDPSKPDLSRVIAKTHHHNFSEYGCKVIQLTVQEIARLGFLGFPRRPDYLHASPVCANFSQAHTAKAGKGIETADDLSAAIAVAKAIRQLQPRVFTLENVPRYQNSQSFAIILDALEQEGYSVDYSVVNMADFGLPQARRRLVLVASRGFRVALPTRRKPIGWYKAIAHLIPSMIDSQLLPKQRQAVEQFLTTNEPTPLLIQKVGGRNGMKYKPGHLPCNTILRSHFTDHKGCNRSRFADIWLPDGTVKSLSIEGAAILQGFPSWYEWPKETATAGSINRLFCASQFCRAVIYSHTETIIRSIFMTNREQLA
ncbi:DnaB-like helicase C-terminal domain-containing protein [Nostoc sp.]|uniref:DnaB-like helicase C-terminal domain-containing protein n=1 Tax=Nostoc sp. TaxID=1180 RepID=UPI002FFD3A97